MKTTLVFVLTRLNITLASIGGGQWGDCLYPDSYAELESSRPGEKTCGQ